MQQKDLFPIIVISGLFSACLAIAAVLSSKIISVAGLFVPAGVIAYCVTFICTDVVSEVYGKKTANLVVLSGFSALVLVFVLIQIALYWPPAPFWQNSESFRAVLGMTPRIIIGSLAAYLVSQFHDVWLFHLLKAVTKDRHLWLRNNASTAVSQFMDSVIFITIAFYGVMPIWPLIFGQWVIKLVIAALDTPVVYAGVGLLRKRRLIMERSS